MSLGNPCARWGLSTHANTYIWLSVTLVMGNTYFHPGVYQGSNSHKTAELMERFSLGAIIVVSDSTKSVQLVKDIDNWFQYSLGGFLFTCSNWEQLILFFEIFMVTCGFYLTNWVRGLLGLTSNTHSFTDIQRSVGLN